MNQERKFLSVAIEGGDSTGKATQAALLREHLVGKGMKVRQVEVPVRSLITHRVIYFMLRANLAMRFPRAFHFVQFINKFWWQTFSLPFIIRKHDAIILDRWHGSYWVYGLQTGLDPDGWLMRLYNVLYKPDLTVVMSGSRHALERRDEYESSDSLQERVRKSYLEWCESTPGCEQVCANGDVLDVHASILLLLYRRLLKKKEPKTDERV